MNNHLILDNLKKWKANKKDEKYTSLFNFPESEFENYYDSCARLKTWKYPIYSIVINYKKGFSNRESFTFIKMDDGYKLIDVTLKMK